MELDKYFDNEQDSNNTMSAYASSLRKLYKENNLKEILKRKKIKVVLASFKILKEDISSFDFNSKASYDYLNSLLLVVKGFLSQMPKNIKKDLVNDISYICNEIVAVIYSRPNYMSDLNEKNYLVLKKVQEVLEEVISSLIDFRSMDTSNTMFIDYVIFEVKDLNIFNDIIKKFPYYVNSHDSNNCPLIERVLDRFLKELVRYVYQPNLGPIDDLIYFEKVYKTILESKNIKLNDNTRRNLLKTLLDTQHKYQFDINMQKEKFNYFIYNAIFTTKGMSVPETIEDLNYKYDIQDRFNAAIKLEAKYIVTKYKKMDSPKPMDKYILTFDCKGAKEIDDALSISLEGGIYKLGVHIADPMHYINRSSSIYQEGLRRTRTLYMDDSCIPMFPKEISRGIAGLTQGNRTFALNYFFDIDAKTGELIKMDITNKPIMVTTNLTYQVFDHILKHGARSERLEKTVVMLNDINKYTSKVYKMTDKYKMFHHDNFNGSGETTIANAMIYTNYQIAKWFYENELPFLYRCHAEDKTKLALLDNIKTTLDEVNNGSTALDNIISRLSKIYPRAYYSTENKEHEGLGIKYYSHCTSPLRRMPDSENSMAIKKFYIQKNYTQDDIIRYREYLRKCAEECNSKRSTLDEYEIYYEDLVKKLKRS